MIGIFGSARVLLALITLRCTVSAYDVVSTLIMAVTRLHVGNQCNVTVLAPPVPAGGKAHTTVFVLCYQQIPL